MKLTKPQEAFLRRLLISGKPEVAYPGPQTRVANGLKRIGLISMDNYVATLTDSGRKALNEIKLT